MIKGWAVEVKKEDAFSLEEYLKQAIAKGTTGDILVILKLLPEDKRTYYREVWKNEVDRNKLK